MFIPTLLRGRFIIIAALALVLATAAYGFAATNTVGASNAGDGAGTISGYAITSPTYVLNASDPTKIDSADFTVTPNNGGIQPATLKVQLVSGGAWYDATHGTGTAWSLDLTPGGAGGVASGAANAITVSSV